MNELLPEKPSFEQSLLELESLVRELEDGRLGLDDALARYEKGVGLIKHCYTQLRQAEQRILLLTGLDEANQPVLQPFKHEATAGVRAEPSRRIRKKLDDPDEGV
jgi:exodeoxyribonuclease VII small subunit